MNREPATRVAVVMSRFPKFTETFVVNEILALERCGFEVDIHPLLPVEPLPHQPAARPLVERARFVSPWGSDALRSLAAEAVRRPVALARLVGRLVVDTWRRPSFLLKDLLLVPRVCAIARAVRADGVEHVHAHFATHGGFAAWAVGRLTGVPYSIVAHGSDVHRHQAMLGTKVAEAAFVTTVSAFNRRVILSVSPPGLDDRVLVEPAGVDLSSIPRRRPDERAAHGGRPVVLCVGTLHEVKGQAHLLRAVSLLGAEGVEVQVELLGDGPDRDDLSRLVHELGIADRVVLRGGVHHEHVLAAYGHAAAVVAPSVASGDGRKEGIPTVLVEAMAAGVPVVASDLAGIPELVRHEHTGLLVPPGDHRALAAALSRLLSDPGLAAELSAAAFALVRADYDVERTSARMADHLRSALNRDRARARGSSR